ncbi:antiviral reverse transcriptase Drt2 [Pseudescherichia sp.]|uniref:antiviral reverse transcriptase Drt2 n=1 Tax=Pseudescherichia sp. TaxID=2055881 RepID=UPI0028B1D015|nr:antiviral reverse transcriptase Drt2 [Pseudescherichia sp.]
MKYPEHPWYKQRGYLHFDIPLSLSHALDIVSNPTFVASHSFYPFINFTAKSFKIKRDPLTGSLRKKEKERAIAYSSHVDSHIFAYYAAALESLYEIQLQNMGIDKNVLAFRKLHKSNIEFAFDAFEEIRKRKNCSAVALDLSKFFDTLDHNILKDAWCKLIGSENLPNDHYAVFKNITRFSKVDKEQLYNLLSISKHNPKFNRKRSCSPEDFRSKVRESGLIIPNKSGRGIPQGSPISALLSNIYMLNFDVDMKQYVERIGGEYYRYCDDMLFIVPTHEKNNVAGEAKKILNTLKVFLNTDKTEIRDFTFASKKITCDKPLQYLGFLFDGDNIFLRSSSLSRYSDRMKKGVSLAKATMRAGNKIRVKKGLKTKELYKEKIYARYAHVGKRNFLTYGYRAARIMNSKSIRKQLKPLWERLQKEIQE